MSGTIDKTEGARRQIETAIDLYFSNGDPYAVYTLAYSSFKVLFDLYPHRNGDDFAKKLDSLLKTEGWRQLSGAANFLKHADKDPHAVLDNLHLQQSMAVIGLGVLLYKRITGDLPIKMMAFDQWVEELGYDELGIVEVDTDQARVEKMREIRQKIRTLPHDQMMLLAKQQYEYFLANFDRLAKVVALAEKEGIPVTDLLNMLDPVKS